MSPEAAAEGPDPGPSKGGIRGLIHDLLSIGKLPLAIGVTVPVSLTLLEYYGMPWHHTRHPPVPPRAPQVDVFDYQGKVRNPPFADHIPDIALPGPNGDGILQ